jgi:energy-coupling factor transporter transmembrane protein EcfT
LSIFFLKILNTCAMSWIYILLRIQKIPHSEFWYLLLFQMFIVFLYLFFYTSIKLLHWNNHRRIHTLDLRTKEHKWPG